MHYREMQLIEIQEINTNVIVDSTADSYITKPSTVQQTCGYLKCNGFKNLGVFTFI